MGRQFLSRLSRHSVRVQFYRRQLYLRRAICFLRLHNAKLHLAITRDAWHGYRRYAYQFSADMAAALT